MTAAHRYSRAPEGIGPDDSLRRLAVWVPHGATVLELGPASGYFSRYLHQELECTVDAVELDADMANRARPYCRKLVVGDLATLDLAAVLDGSRYNVIVAADVIEHLVQPSALLDRLRPLLAPHGRLLLSVPNVAYAGLVVALLQGRFEYRDEGLLDRTHLRFFTRESLFALLEAAGFHVHAYAPVFRPLNESEFKIRLETLPTVLREVLLSSPHALCYQWLVNAAVESAPVAPAMPTPTDVDAFPLRAHWGAADNSSGDLEEVVGWGRVGTERQTLCVVLPSAAHGPIRLYLSDRPGFMRLFAVSLHRGDACLWSWRADEGATALCDASEGLSLVSATDHVLATLHLPHAWLQLKGEIPSSPDAELLLTVELGWPMSADYMAAAHGWSQAVSRLSREVETLRANVAAQASQVRVPSSRWHWRRWIRQLVSRFSRSGS